MQSRIMVVGVPPVAAMAHPGGGLRAGEGRCRPIASIVRRVIKAEQGDVDRIESLAAEAAEHLEDDDLYGACLMRAPQRDG